MANNILKKYGLIFLVILFIGLPFHAFFVTYLSSFLDSHNYDNLSSFSFVISAWKELLMVLMIGVISVVSIKKKQFPFRFLLVDYLIFLLLVWAFLSAIFQSDSFLQGLVGMRFDFQFFILYWIVRSIPVAMNDFKKLIRVLLLVSIVVVIIGFVQISLSCEIMTKFGYTPYISSWVSFKPLPCAHGLGTNLEQFRMMSTFSGPNQLGSFLIITIMMAWYMLSAMIKKYSREVIQISNKLISLKYFYIFTIALSFAALYLTYSRGALLSVLVAFFCLLVLQASDSKRAFGYLVIGITMSVLVLVLSIVMHPERIDSTGQHLEKPLEGIRLVVENPWGFGVGMAGPASMRFPPDGSKAIISENWYLQIAQEFGLIGAFVFFLLLSSVLRFLFQKWSNVFSGEQKDLLLTTLAIYVGILFNNLFLHTWSSDMVTSLIFWSLFAIVANFANDSKKKVPLPKRDEL